MKKKFINDYVLKEDASGYSYEGEYYNANLEKSNKSKIAIFNIVLMTAEIILLLMGGMLNNPGSHKVYIVIPFISMTLPTIYYLMGTIMFIRIDTSHMEAIQYAHTIKRMYKTSIWNIVLNLITLASDVAFILKINSSAEQMFILIAFVLLIINCTMLVSSKKLQQDVTAVH